MNWHHTSARILLALVGATAAIAAAPALASAHHGHVRVTGTYTVYDFGTTTCVPENAAGDILACTTTGLKSAYDGSLKGDSTVDFTQTVNCTTGRTHGHGVETFTGVLGGGTPGTLTWIIRFRSALDCATFAPSDFRALAWIGRSSDGLAGTHGLLRFGDVSYDGVLAR
jgi:hypothetical protein